MPFLKGGSVEIFTFKSSVAHVIVTQRDIEK